MPLPRTLLIVSAGLAVAALVQTAVEPVVVSGWHGEEWLLHAERLRVSAGFLHGGSPLPELAPGLHLLAAPLDLLGLRTAAPWLGVLGILLAAGMVESVARRLKLAPGSGVAAALLAPAITLATGYGAAPWALLLTWAAADRAVRPGIGGRFLGGVLLAGLALLHPAFSITAAPVVVGVALAAGAGWGLPVVALGLLAGATALVWLVPGLLGPLGELWQGDAVGPLLPGLARHVERSAGQFSPAGWLFAPGALLAGLSPLLLAAALFCGRRAPRRVWWLLLGPALLVPLTALVFEQPRAGWLFPALPAPLLLAMAGADKAPRSTLVLALVALLVGVDARVPTAPWSPRIPLPSLGGRPTELRGVGAASSAGDRAWTRVDDRRPPRAAMRRRLGGLADSCGWTDIGVPTWIFDDHGEAGWWEYRSALRRWADPERPPIRVLVAERSGRQSFWWEREDALDRRDEGLSTLPFPTDGEGRVVGAPLPDVVVLAIEGGELPDLRAVDGGRWRHAGRLGAPAGELPVGIWVPVDAPPCDALDLLDDSPFGTGPE